MVEPQSFCGVQSKHQIWFHILSIKQTEFHWNIASLVSCLTWLIEQSDFSQSLKYLRGCVLKNADGLNTLISASVQLQTCSVNFYNFYFICVLILMKWSKRREATSSEWQTGPCSRKSFIVTLSLWLETSKPVAEAKWKEVSTNVGGK